MVKQAVILAGGKGTRISEYTSTIPKPLIMAKGMPLIWYIMYHFYQQGVNNFIILTGYKSELILDYFNSKLADEVKLENLGISEFLKQCEINVIDTGVETMTGGRLKLAEPYLQEDFFLTYGDGIANVELNSVMKMREKGDFKVCVTAVIPPARFGSLSIDSENRVESFQEKIKNNSDWINGGFMYVNKSILNLITGDDCVLERDVLSKVAAEGQMIAYKHDSFWQPVDTLRELHELEEKLPTFFPELFPS